MLASQASDYQKLQEQYETLLAKYQASEKMVEHYKNKLEEKTTKDRRTK